MDCVTPMKSIKLPERRFTDMEFEVFCLEHGYCEDQVIEVMVEAGWTLGRTEDFSQNVFLPPIYD